MMRFARVPVRLLLLSIAALGPVEAQQYVISTVAGGGLPPTPARGVSLSTVPLAVTTDASGNAYFSAIPSCVFKLDPNGIVTRVAGSSRPGYSGDGGLAASAQLNYAFGVAMDGAGNLFIADAGNNRIRRVSPDGIIATVAGNGTRGYSGDGGPATNTQLMEPIGVAVDGAGNLFIADLGNARIRKVSPNGIIATVAGNGTHGYSGDGGPATNAQLMNPIGVAVDGAGNLFIADPGNARIRKVSTDGTIVTVAGDGIFGFSGDGGPATGAHLSSPHGVAVDGAGSLFIVEEGSRIRKVSTDGTITTVAGGGTSDFSVDGGPATEARLIDPSGVAVDIAGNLFIADDVLRKVSPEGIITTVAGGGKEVLGDGGTATSAHLDGRLWVAVDSADNLFIADSGNNRIRKVSPDGIITTVAGNGIRGFSGDGGPAIAGQLSSLTGLAADSAGNLFIAQDSRVRKVSPDGTITTVAGNSRGGFSGDGGPATNAQLNGQIDVAADGAGNLFIADGGNNRIRKISSDGMITTVAGNGTQGFSGDGGPATSAQLNFPADVAVDGRGTLYIADVNNRSIRIVSRDGTISTLADPRGDTGTPTGARPSFLTQVAVDGAGNLFLADINNYRIRKVSPDGMITTVAGNGTQGFSGDGGPATSAQLSNLGGLTVDGAGNVYVADEGNGVVRVLRPVNSALITAVVDAASHNVKPISPGKIVVIYGVNLGPAELVENQPGNGRFGTAVGGTVVSFNGIAAPVLYASATQVAAVVPYAINGTAAQVTVAYQGEPSAAFAVSVAPSSPSFFTLNQSGAGQAAATNADGTVNTAANPIRIGGVISLYATGEGQTSPVGVDGRLAGSSPVLPVKVTVDGIPATVQYAGGAPGLVAGLMQINVQIPNDVQPGGYVPVLLQVGDASTTSGAVWIAVSRN